jgi:1,4-alpha-glucan branching enzyme
MKTLPLNSNEVFLFHNRLNTNMHRLLGAHEWTEHSKKGIRFAVWAPNASRVNVLGTFNRWNSKGYEMKKVRNSGIWTLFTEDASRGDLYKYEVHSLNGVRLKADPYAFFSEVRPNTASVVSPLGWYTWNDEGWISKRSRTDHHKRPVNIYEVHFGSWKRDEKGELLTYRQMADELVAYVVDMGYTHIELMPLSEHPFDGSWGYQITGYFSVTSRYGTPDDFKHFVDTCHGNGIGVIMDWVPSHFCKDEHGLSYFDSTPLYESSDFKYTDNPQWGTSNFDFFKPEVISFLISNAKFWIEEYHIDGLRVDAVACMLYLNFGKDSDNWSRNMFGGNENLPAISFMKMLNETISEEFPNVLMIAEESTSWPLVSSPVFRGGLGFSFKWNMGWMNDTLRYFEIFPDFRNENHNLITFSFMYAFSENFMLAISHDEVVHGKKSLIGKMAGDYWQKFASARLLFSYMMAHPGKKLSFMGNEIGQFIEWRYYEGLEWFILGYENHANLQKFVKTINKLYLNESALWKNDSDWSGFEWIDANNSSQSVVSFVRKTGDVCDDIIVVMNFTPKAYENYSIGVDVGGMYAEVLNSDDTSFSGSGVVNDGMLKAKDVPCNGRNFSIELRIPPLGAVFIKMAK